MKKRMLAAAVLAGLLLGLCGLGFHSVQTVMSGQTLLYTPTLIVDAGHGGFDGGAVGAGDTVEKDINLAIAQQLAALAQLNGFEVLMVREDDRAVHDTDKIGLRNKKVSDIHNRLKLAQEHPDAIYVSIHQNHFPQAQYWGTQVFYSRNHPESLRLAQRIQQNVRQNLQPENKREIKPAEKNLYILHHAKNTAVLVECGFLSNEQECQRLCRPEYQQQLAFEILRSLLEMQQPQNAEGTDENDGS